MSSCAKILKMILIFCFISGAAVAESWDSSAETVIIQKGETWNNLAKKFNIPAKMIQRYNNSKALNKTITIPAKITYIVQNGETSLGIAVKFGMTLSEIANINNLNAPYIVKPKQKLKVIAMNAKNKPMKKLDKASIPKLDWPVLGKIVRTFGSQENGAKHDGIYILLEKDDAIKAAADGGVVYAGNEIGSYGNLIIIQHDGGWFSSYGLLNDVCVKKGDVVKAGQVIGNALEKSELYFSLRQEQKAVNPLKYLPKQKKR